MIPAALAALPHLLIAVAFVIALLAIVTEGYVLAALLPVRWWRRKG